VAQKYHLLRKDSAWSGGLIEEILKYQADLVGAGGFQMGVDDVQVVELFPLAGGEVVGVLEPDIAAAGEFGMVFAFEASDFFQQHY